MNHNPYRSPATLRTEQRSFRWRTLIGRIEIAICAEFAVLILAAIAHRLQLNMENVEAYTRSPLIFVEVLGVLGAFGIIPIALIRCIYLMAHQRGGAAIVDLLLCPLAFGSILAAMAIDSPTLVYAT
jgi:hypothetical protein